MIGKSFTKEASMSSKPDYEITPTEDGIIVNFPARNALTPTGEKNQCYYAARRGRLALLMKGVQEEQLGEIADNVLMKIASEHLIDEMVDYYGSRFEVKGVSEAEFIMAYDKLSLIAALITKHISSLVGATEFRPEVVEKDGKTAIRIHFRSGQPMGDGLDDLADMMEVQGIHTTRQGVSDTLDITLNDGEDLLAKFEKLLEWPLNRVSRSGGQSTGAAR
jgi:hypothetical protein